MKPPVMLEGRFHAPDNWQWGHCTNAQGRPLRFGFAAPAGRARAAVLILPGRSEFIEKYFETARDLLAMGLAVWAFDWQGQGLSHRQPGRSRNIVRTPPFAQHISDLHGFITDVIKPGALDPVISGLPLFMLAQSMGGHLGLRYLQSHPGVFMGAALMAPMIRIRALEPYPRWLMRLVLPILGRVFPEIYAPGETHWQAGKTRKGLPMSYDDVRAGVHEAWYAAHAPLQLGGATFEWLWRAQESSDIMDRAQNWRALQTPCLLTLSGRDDLVSADAIKRVADLLPRGRLLAFAECGHEILMEKDQYRRLFLEAFQALVNEAMIGHEAA